MLDVRVIYTQRDVEVIFIRRQDYDLSIIGDPLWLPVLCTDDDWRTAVCTLVVIVWPYHLQWQVGEWPPWHNILTF